MSAINVTRENFDRINSEERPVLLDFYAPWCGPCRTVLPIVDEIAREREDIFVGKINVEEEVELARRFGVVSIPTLVVLKEGEVVSRAVGARRKDGILELVSSS